MSDKDLLDLCMLNLLEESALDSSNVDAAETLQTIDFKKRQVMEKIPKIEASSEVFQKHLDRQGPDEFLRNIETLEDVVKD